VRFDYRRRDGEESRRLVQPHQLVSAGRRWYLVAWDVRREDWRSFRLDRMTGPALAGARFEARVLPADDAAEFVRAGMRAMTTEHRAIVNVGATTEELAHESRWFGTRPTPLDDGRTQLELASESTDWLSSMVLILAAHHELELVEAPDEVRRSLALAARRIDRLSTRS
jgi:predicted DNA-binding transcriptional regulator YafY